MFYQVYFTIPWVESGWRGLCALGQSSSVPNRSGNFGVTEPQPVGENKPWGAQHCLTRLFTKSYRVPFIPAERLALSETAFSRDFAALLVGLRRRCRAGEP